MNVSDAMTANPVTIHQDDKLINALKLMDQVGCHHLPVISADGHLVGILSDRDCRTALNSPYVLQDGWENDELARTLSIRKVMSPAPIIAEPDTSAVQAARLMLNNRISCLPVLRGETLVGIITRSDLLIAFIRMMAGASSY